MKRLILKCLLMLAIVGSIFGLGGAAYRRTNAYKNLEIVEETVKFYTMPEQIDVAAFGSSHGRNAYPSFPAAEHFFNFSMSSQTPQYDEKMLLQFGDRLTDDALVLLTVSYFTPFWGDTQEDFEEKQGRYYRILSPEHIVEANLPRYYLGKFSPLLTTPFPDVLTAFLKQESLNTSVEEGKSKQITREEIPAEQKRIRKDHIDKIILQNGTYPDPQPVMWEAYQNILSKCQQAGWRAVLVTPPYLAEYNDCFPEEILSTFSETVKELAEEYEVLWLDYSHHEEFSGEYKLFRDIDHLNAAGGEKFVCQLEIDLRDLGYLE